MATKNIRKKLNLNVHNKFELTLIDKDGKVKQKAYAYNVVLDKFWYALLYISKGQVQFGYQIGIGTGSGTPAATDTALFTELVKASCSVQSSTKEYPTSTFIYQATFPASATYVGTITEVGMYYHLYYHGQISSQHEYGYWTHALLQDSEGGTITITKTDTDTLIITSTVYVTITSSDFVLAPASDNNILNMFTGMTQKIWGNKGYNASYPGLPAIVPFNPDAAVKLGTDIKYTTDYAFAIVDNSGADSYDDSAKTVTWDTARIPESSGLNGHMLWALCITGLGYILLPNTSFFPVYTTANTLVGTGDSSEDTFICPIPLFVEDTDVVKVAGVTKTRNTDYTIEHDGNSVVDTASMISRRAIILSDTMTIDGYAAVPFSKSPKSYDSHVVYGISDTIPLVLDIGSAVKCNKLYLSKICSGRSSSGESSIATIYLESSTDNISWTPVLTIAETTYAGSTTGAVPTGGPEFSFTEVTARYWRLRATFSGTYKTLVMDNNTDEWWLGYVGQGIIFASPPATDEIITIAANVEVPWKTSDYVIDIGLTLEF